MSKSIIKPDEKGILTLYVNGKPFFCYGGELHNSDASDPEYMEREVWPKLADLHMNTVIAPVYWELIEEKEGEYDYKSVDSLILQAREHSMKLVLLWFGLWKNAESMYVPAWMKQDTKTYFRAEKVNGEKLNTISPFCTAAVEKDAAAFSALMVHIRQLDEEECTVIFIQVENEIGVLGAARDYSTAANEAFNDAVPEELLASLQKEYKNSRPQAGSMPHCNPVPIAAGSWRQVFGDQAEENFMAWAYARDVEKIASSGQAQYDLPMYVNSWLKQYPWYPGSYPMGGPVPDVHAIWRTFAPSLFAFGPDIYVPNCADVMDDYTTDQNPLVIPEIRKDAETISYCLYAFGAKNAICFSPFGIEELAADPDSIEKPPIGMMQALNIDPSAFDVSGSKELVAHTYELLQELEPILLKWRGTRHLKSFVRHGENDSGAYLIFDQYEARVSYSRKAPGKPVGAGIFIELDEDTFLLTGTMCQVQFTVRTGENKQAGYLRLEEGTIHDGQWKRGRVLNGDEQMFLHFGEMPQTLLLKLYKY